MLEKDFIPKKVISTGSTVLPHILKENIMYVVIYKNKVPSAVNKFCIPSVKGSGMGDVF